MQNDPSRVPKEMVITTQGSSITYNLYKDKEGAVRGLKVLKECDTITEPRGVHRNLYFTYSWLNSKNESKSILFLNLKSNSNFYIVSYYPIVIENPDGFRYIKTYRGNR